MHIVEGLPSLRKLRLRSSSMMSDRALDVLQQSTQQFRVIEIEPSYTMSTYMLDQLRAKLTRGFGTSFPEIFPGSFTAMLLLGETSAQSDAQHQPITELRVLKPVHEEDDASSSFSSLRLNWLGRREDARMYIGR